MSPEEYRTIQDGQADAPSLIPSCPPGHVVGMGQHIPFYSPAASGSRNASRNRQSPGSPKKTAPAITRTITVTITSPLRSLPSVLLSRCLAPFYCQSRLFRYGGHPSLLDCFLLDERGQANSQDVLAFQNTSRDVSPDPPPPPPSMYLDVRTPAPC